MPLLLDTHVLLWFAEDSSRLSDTARELIRRADVIHVSAVTIWELGIKQSLSRFGIENDTFASFVEKCLRNCNAELLPLRVPHVVELTRLPLIHRDPFDRMLVAQAISEELTLVSQDRHVAQYPCDVVW